MSSFFVFLLFRGLLFLLLECKFFRLLLLSFSLYLFMPLFDLLFLLLSLYFFLFYFSLPSLVILLPLFGLCLFFFVFDLFPPKISLSFLIFLFLLQRIRTILYRSPGLYGLSRLSSLLYFRREGVRRVHRFSGWSSGFLHQGL